MVDQGMVLAKAICRLLRTMLHGALWISVVACVGRNTTPQQTSEPSIVSTVRPPVVVTDLIVGQAPSYQGIIPGRSHKREVLSRLGEPNIVKTHGAYESLHYFNNGAQEYFLIENDVVQTVTTNALRDWLIRDGHPVTLDNLTQLLGAPEVITPTFDGAIYVFTDYGIAVSANIRFYQFFVPMNLQDYQVLWGELPLGYDPFPLISSVEKARLKPGQTTRDQIARFLGTPDRIMLGEHNVTWIYDIEPDMFGRLEIFFNSENIVSNIFIDRIAKITILENIVSQYGQPDMLQRIPDFEGQAYETLALLYLDRGLRVATRCVTSSCEIVKRDSVVEQKWYFPLTTLAEYQKEFPESAFIEWHGFDE